MKLDFTKNIFVVFRYDGVLIQLFYGITMTSHFSTDKGHRFLQSLALKQTIMERNHFQILENVTLATHPNGIIHGDIFETFTQNPTLVRFTQFSLVWFQFRLSYCGGLAKANVNSRD